MSSSKADLRVDWCSYGAAKFAVEYWHYSKTMPRSKLSKMGVWEDGRFIGALVFGLGASGNLGAPYGLDVFSIAELQRVALTRHKATVSKIVMIAVKLVHRRFSRLRAILSYADPNHGHVGGIYQAMGWVYTGLTAPTRDLLLPSGRIVHSRVWSTSGTKTMFGRRSATFTENDGQIIIMEGKHRYLYPLDDEIRAIVEEKRLPYPKRQKDSSEPSAHRAEEGGAAPTLALQE